MSKRLPLIAFLASCLLVALFPLFLLGGCTLYSQNLWGSNEGCAATQPAEVDDGNVSTGQGGGMTAVMVAPGSPGVSLAVPATSQPTESSADPTEPEAEQPLPSSPETP